MKKIQTKKINKKIVFFVIFMCLVVVSGFAEDPLSGPLEKLTNFLRGTLVKTVAVIATMGAGFMMIYTKGQGAKVTFIFILLGTAVIFGAPQLFDMIFK